MHILGRLPHSGTRPTRQSKIEDRWKCRQYAQYAYLTGVSYGGTSIPHFHALKVSQPVHSILKIPTMSDATKPSAASGNDQAIKWDGPEWRVSNKRRWNGRIKVLFNAVVDWYLKHRCLHSWIYGSARESHRTDRGNFRHGVPPMFSVGWRRYLEMIRGAIASACWASFVVYTVRFWILCCRDNLWLTLRFDAVPFAPFSLPNWDLHPPQDLLWVKRLTN